MKKRNVIVFFIVFLVSLLVTFLLLVFNNKNEEIKNPKKVKTGVIINSVNKKLYVGLVNKVNQDYVYDSDTSITKIVSKNNVNESKESTDKKYYGEDIKEDEKEIEIEETSKSENIIEEEDEKTKELKDVHYEEILEDKKEDDEISSVKEIINPLKNGFYDENGITYYYENDVKVTGLKKINGVNNYFSPSGRHLGTNKVKVVDVSYYQKDINWDLFAKESDCYGVILRLGYYDTLDKKFERNILELKRLNIPYGIYLFSYATTLNGAKKEAIFTNNMISKYDINPTLGIYYDIESWSTKTSNSNNITKSKYDEIIQYYINSVSNYINYKYKVKVYSGRWYAMNRLGNISKKYVDWVAEYNNTCKYDNVYSMWQYTSKGSVPGINGNVDISYIL